MQILRIHHAQVTTPEGAEEAARGFYCGVLGLKEINKPAELEGRGGFWVQVGDRQLHIGTEEGVDRTLTKAHIAYEVDDLESWRRKLQTEGLEIAEPPEVPGYERFEFRDPFGNRIEFTQPIAT